MASNQNRTNREREQLVEQLLEAARQQNNENGGLRTELDASGSAALVERLLQKKNENSINFNLETSRSQGNLSENSRSNWSPEKDLNVGGSNSYQGIDIGANVQTRGPISSNSYNKNQISQSKINRPRSVPPGNNQKIKSTTMNNSHLENNNNRKVNQNQIQNQNSNYMNQSLRQYADEFKMPLEEKAELWAAQHKRGLQRREQLKKEQENEELKACTFKPTAATREAQGNNLVNGYEETLEDRFQRLHHEADQRNQIREKAKSLLDEAEIQEYTFKPRINDNAEIETRRKPLCERVNEIQSKKAALLLRKQMEIELEQNATFKPKISTVSERMVKRKREVQYAEDSATNAGGGARGGLDRKHMNQEQQSAAERLYNDSKLRKDRDSDPKDSKNDKLTNLAPKTDKIVQSSVFFQGPCQNFLVRQQTFEDARVQRRELRRKIMESDNKFQPSISKVSDALAKSNPERVKESFSERIERLSTKEMQRRNEQRKELAESKFRDLSFRPSINPVSRSITSEGQNYQGQGPGTNKSSLTAEGGNVNGINNNHGNNKFNNSNNIEVHERLYEEAKERANATTLAKIETEERMRREYTFKPDVRSRTNRKSMYSTTNNSNLIHAMMEEKRKKELLLERKRLDLEEKATQECTFKPAKGRKPPSDSQPIIVHGLSRFLENKEAARRKAEEKREAEEQAFGYKSKGGSNLECKRTGGVTIPTPFQLSTTKLGSQRRTRANLDIQQKQQEYTFRPQTLAAERQQMLEEILTT